MRAAGRFVVALLAVFGATAALASSAGAQPEEGVSEMYAVPEIVLWIHGSGGDAIDAWLPLTEIDRDREGVMRDIAAVVGGDSMPARLTGVDDFYYDEISAQFDGRVSTRDGSDLDFRFDSDALTSLLADRGYYEYSFAVCAPDIGSTLVSEPAPDEDDGLGADYPDTNCASWYVDRGESLSIDLHLDGTSEDYARLAATFVGLGVLGAVLAYGGALLLRRSFVRTLGTAAFVLLAVGLVAAVAPAVVAGFTLAILDATTTSHAIAADLSQREQVIATLLPVLALALPGTAFAFGMATTPANPYAPRPVRGGPPVPPGQPMPPPGTGVVGPPPAVRTQTTPPPDAPGLPSWLDER